MQLLSFLGAGATSSVYKCRHPSSQTETVAAKVPREPHTTSYEHLVLLELAGCLCIPHVVAQLDNEHGLLLQPVGMPLALHGTLTRHPLLFRGLLRLVQALRTAHEKGWLHRDLRPDNLVIVGEDRMFIIDWYVGRLLCW